MVDGQLTDHLWVCQGHGYDRPSWQKEPCVSLLPCVRMGCLFLKRIHTVSFRLLAETCWTTWGYAKDMHMTKRTLDILMPLGRNRCLLLNPFDPNPAKSARVVFPQSGHIRPGKQQFFQNLPHFFKIGP